MLTENSDALSAYLACSSSFIQDPHRPAPAKTFQDCATEWERAELSWRKVEKRLRQVVTCAIVDQKEARNFILMVEDILLEMDAYLDRLEEEMEGTERTTTVPFVYSIPHEMEHHFARPVRVSSTSKHTPVLQITLRDSAYHRLLLHATCQFHSRNSKVSHSTLSSSLTPPLPQSHTEKVPNTSISFRVTNVSSFASRKRTGHHTVSLVPFILSQHSGTEPSGEVTQTVSSLHDERYEIVSVAS
jgi:hypothetical protein